MLFRITLVNTAPGCFDISEEWERGFIVEDRREGAADLIRQANAKAGTRPIDGEVYRIEVVEYPRYFEVFNNAGHVRPWRDG